MNEGCTVFAQVCAHAPTSSFRRCVTRYGAERYVKSFSCWDQFLCMVFAQFTHRESLRDIEACLRSLSGRLYQLGVRRKVSRSTLADANQCRDWRTYADFAQVPIGIARRLYRDEAWAIDLAKTVYAFDSTTIDLCLALFPWAPFQKGKAAIKLHTLLDLRGNIPTVIHITHGRIGDVSMLPALTAEPNSFYVFDRGYMDFEQLYRSHQGHAFFVVRAWKNLQFRRRYPRAADRPAGVPSDQTVLLTGKKSARRYPDPLRRIHYRDPESACDLVFLTNNFELPAVTVAALYKSRWQVGVSRQGYIVQSVKDRPGPKDSGLVAGEAPWRESQTAEPSDNMLRKECAQRTRLQRAVNVDVASLHESPVAETVDNARKQQGLTETSPMRQFSPAGYQRRHGVKEDVETGEALGARRRNLAEEMPAITLSGKCRHRRQGSGSGRSTVDGRAAKRARREGPGPVSISSVKERQG